MEKIAEAVKISSTLIKGFHRLTGATNPIHLDEQIAKDKGFRAPIAHGNLLVALLLEQFFRTYPNIAKEGIEIDLKFIRPVCAGDTVQIWSDVNIEKEAPSIEIRVGENPTVTGSIKIIARAT